MMDLSSRHGGLVQAGGLRDHLHVKEGEFEYAEPEQDGVDAVDHPWGGSLG